MVAEVQFQKEANTPWGFRLTGGPKFGMPLTVFEVEEGGRAYKAGIRLGDVLVRINGMEADRLSLDDAHHMITAAGNNINLSVSNLEDQELRESEELAKANASLTDHEDTDTEDKSRELHKSDISEQDTSEIQHSEASDSEAPRTETSLEDISGLARSEVSEATSEVSEATSEESSMSKGSKSESERKDVKVEEEEEYVDVRSLPLKPPRPAPEPDRAQRRCWHPVMLDTNPPPIIEESTGEEEYPHKQRIRNIRKLIADKKQKQQPRKHYQEVKTSFTVRVLDEKANVGEAEKKPEPDTAVTLQLRTMQHQLQQLVQLPAAIQATLQAVSSHIDTLLPTPPPPPNQPSNNVASLVVQSDDSGEFLEEDFTESFEGLTEEEWSDMEVQRPASQSDSETPAPPSPPSTPTEDELQRVAKVEKLQTLNKCWPWADSAKPVYKIAEHYEPVYARCINNKVKWLETKITEDQILAKNLKGV